MIALNNITLKKKQLEENLDYAIDTIIAKINKLEEPIFSRCNEIISGTGAPKVEELGTAKSRLNEE